MRRLWQRYLCWTGMHRGEWIPTPYCVQCPHCGQTWAVV